MQFSISEYNADLHDLYNGLIVKQPMASMLVKPYKKEGGHTVPERSIVLMTRITGYRGDVMICADKKPVVFGLESGVMVGIAELFDIKRVEDFTQEDWDNCGLGAPGQKVIMRKRFRFGWCFRNPRQVVEFPAESGSKGLFKLVYTKDVIFEYPVFVSLRE